MDRRSVARRMAWSTGALASVAALCALAGLPPAGSSGDAPRAAPESGAILVRAVEPDSPRVDGKLLEVSPDGGVERVGDVVCKRVHAVAGGPGLCLALSKNGIDYEAIVLDRRFERTTSFPIDGVPDRARVSPDGRYGAYTSFDPKGSQGYFESSFEFSTYTRIVSLRSGRELLRLEDLEVTRAGRPLALRGAELWGVTFAAGGRYYATLAAAGEHFLIAGRVGSDRARVVRAGVECPALSPDGERIAYKRRIGDGNRWRFHVLRLSDGHDIALAEPRSIDDQPEWLGNDRIVYSDDHDVFSVPVGGGGPERLATRATSPAALLPRR